VILSKQNLQAAQIASIDKNIPLLGNVHVDKDGSSIASDRKTLLLVGPVEKEIKQRVVGALGPGGINFETTIPVETVKEVLKNLPKDNKFSGLLEHVKIEQAVNQEIHFTLTDGKRHQFIKGKAYPKGYTEYKKVVKQVLAGRDNSLRLAVNRKRFINLLTAIDKICSDATGEAPLFLEFNPSGEIVIRAYNPRTGQRVIGIVFALSRDEEKWLPPSVWETKFTDIARIAHK